MEVKVVIPSHKRWDRVQTICAVDRIYGVQKSLLKGHSDMPLFASSSEEKQAELFGE